MFVIIFALAGSFSACTQNLTDKERIVTLFEQNEMLITDAVQTGDFEKVRQIKGIQNVYISEQYNYIDFECGGSGFGPSTHYYGFYFSPEDDLTAWNGGACPVQELIVDGEGYSWQEIDGDNRYYVEKIGDHFYYYEAHF